MLEIYDPITAAQLRDCAINISQKKNKSAILEMYSRELKFASDHLKNDLPKNTENVFPNLTQCRKNL